MNENLNHIVNNKLFVLKILWLGILISVLILTGVSYYLTALHPHSTTNLNESINTVFLIVAFSSFGISISLEKIWTIQPDATFNRFKFIDSKKNLRTQHGQAIWSESDLQNLTTFTDAELQKLAALDKGYLRFLMGLTTAETCVLLGFINVYLSGQFTKNISICGHGPSRITAEVAFRSKTQIIRTNYCKWLAIFKISLLKAISDFVFCKFSGGNVKGRAL